jgi:hypothetical protein
MKTLVLAATLGFFVAAPTPVSAPVARAAAVPVAGAPATLPGPGWPLILSGLAAAVRVARRRLHNL